MHSPTLPVKCRYNYPRQLHALNAVQDGVRWRLHLPGNDPLMGQANQWQFASQGANVDFSPLVDHVCAVEYTVKYAGRGIAAAATGQA